ncbi:LysR substrate-binding domain-containing protein [Pigmentiphaga sp. GD03639]|uniref:LysR substrate-binding domain-containing protein n=1 Tax=Pigmentiphaga daeguensis TaxID=414049 RepID=A0ABN1BEU7_9BURK|nr:MULTISPECIES: LysR substrate-binding domain-containing protein [unclassified Pigmentiphaga]MDH2238276.1 LysR substrate-binding domain-containing protein [Pigmentiphaga sp. GD03639]
MNLRTLRYFVAIVDAGSLSAAAQAISIAQPALSRQLRELEREMGQPLLIRGARGVRLTAAGLTLYESAQRMLAEAARLRRQMTQRPASAATTVTIGISPTLAAVLVPGLFEQSRRGLDGIRIKVREAFTPSLLEWVERGMVDMAVVTNPSPGGALALQPLLGEPFALVANVALGLGPVIPATQLHRMPLLMTSLHRDIVDRQLMPLGVDLRLEAEIDSVDAIRELVCRGRWATIMPISVFKDLVAAGRVTGSEITGVQLNRMLVLARRIERDSPAAYDAVQDLLHAEFARLNRANVFGISNLGGPFAGERDAMRAGE